MSGTVNISRDLWGDEAFAKEAFSEREAWVWMICEASWKPRKKRVGDAIIDLKRGQLAASIRFMAEAFGWHRNKVHRFIQRLANLGLIMLETGTAVSLITICNYDKYQSGGTARGTGAGQERDTCGTNDKKDAIRVKEGEEANASSCAKPAPDEGFAAFWEIWPSKKSKEPARKAWRKLSMADRRSAFSAIRGGWFDEWQQANPYASPIHAATFLNQRRWEDQQEPLRLRAISGGIDDNRTHNRNGASQGRQNRPDAALEQIARLAGLGKT